MRESRKFWQRRSNFDNVFFKVDEGREDPSPTLSGSSSARQPNAIKWRFADMPMNAQLSQLRFLRESGPVLLENPIFCDFSGGGGVRTPVPPLDPHMYFHDILVLITCNKDSDEPAQVCILNTALMAQVCQASLLLC